MMARTAKDIFSLLKNPDFLFLWMSQVISQFGDKLNQMALVAWAYAIMPGSSFQMAKLIFFTIIPVFLIGPFAAAAVDRLDNRKTMYICDLLRSVSVIAIPVFILPGKLILPVYIIVFISFCLSRLFVPAKMSIVPEIVERENLMLANSLLSLTGIIAAMFGFGIGGILVQHIGPKGGFIIDGITFLISGVFIYLIGIKYKPKDVSIGEEARGLFSAIKNVFDYVFKGAIANDIKEGIVYLGQSKDLISLSKVLFVLWGLLGGIYATGIVFVQKTLGSATGDLGMIVVFLAAGLFIGSLVFGGMLANADRLRTIYISLFFVSVILAGFALFLPVIRRFFAASGFAFLMGFAASPIVLVSQTLVHESSHNKMRGRMFGTIEIIVHLAFIIAMLASSLIAEVITERYVILTWAGFGIFTSIFSLFFHRPELCDKVGERVMRH